MRNILVITLLFCLVGSGLDAQNPDYRSGITFKKMFLDYQSQNGGSITNFNDYRHGFEIGYQASLSNNVVLNFPARYGVVDTHIDSINCLKKKIASLDAQLQYQFNNPTSKIIPYVLIGAGGVYEMEGEFNIQIPVGLGFYFKLGPKAFVSLQSEYRYALTDGRKNFQHGLGFTYLLGPDVEKKEEEGKTNLNKDSDMDGVPDDLDLCPNDFGTKELNGCPDKDGDEVPDYLDKCPDVKGAKKFSGCPDTDGDGIPDNEDECPKMAGPASNKGCPIADADGDGVPDDIDECPKKPGPASNKGCPIADRDGDGVPDDIDKCPDEKGSAETMGCPDTDGDGVIDKEDRCPTKPGLKIYYGCPDTDGDGIDDSRDKCPNTPGTVANDGCPELKKEDKKTLDVAMQAVQFQTGSAILKTESNIVLSQIGDILNRYPDFNMVISGHTDNTGSSVANQSLSERRAKACYDFLIKNGVSSARLSFSGYGESRPISSNETEKGKMLNRRVEFNMVPKQ
jgi:outer membrane protein OmpA-like peptidoglycan-associated protein